ncbi:hypothetical protein J4442_00985 [Candidatus Woesearchaeota archaeon]|nr:hypothetical protein [Candidatus Woesearchaeota archaeon]
MDKKGAIEFSMTTIMVIIIGVAVLALGLTWVRGTFTQVGTITEAALENAETIFGEVGFTGKIGTPAVMIMESDDAKRYRVNLRNTGTTPITLDATATIIGGTPANCITGVPATSEKIATGIVIPGGGTTEIGGGILTKDCTEGGIVRIDVVDTTPNPDISYTSEAIAIQIR